MIRITLPFHLRTLAHIEEEEVRIEVQGLPTLSAAIDALEARHPVLRGTIRDYATGRRRPFLRFYACEKDLSNDPPEKMLPEGVLSGKEPLLIIGSIAGG